MALLAAKTFDFIGRQALDTGLPEFLFYGIECERLDDGFNLFHFPFLYDHLTRRSTCDGFFRQ
jgi:hypothetical protein